MGYIDSTRIKEVHKDPENALLDAELVLKPSKPGGEDELAKIIHVSRSASGSGDSRKVTRKYEGDTFFWAINRPTGGTRGTPDLLATADWIDGHDQILFNALDRTALQNAFVWDVELMGADADRITEWLNLHGEAPSPEPCASTTTPRSGTRCHRRWEPPKPRSWPAWSRTSSSGSTGMPEAWFAEGDSANRATLAEQGSPTYKMIRSRQSQVRAMLTRLITYVVDKAKESGRITSTELEFQRQPARALERRHDRPGDLAAAAHQGHQRGDQREAHQPQERTPGVPHGRRPARHRTRSRPPKRSRSRRRRRRISPRRWPCRRSNRAHPTASPPWERRSASPPVSDRRPRPPLRRWPRRGLPLRLRPTRKKAAKNGQS